MTESDELAYTVFSITPLLSDCPSGRFKSHFLNKGQNLSNIIRRLAYFYVTSERRELEDWRMENFGPNI